MNPIQLHYETLANTVKEGLRKRQMEGYYFSSSEEAVKKALSFLPDGCLAGFGGSMTLMESGMYDALKQSPSVRLLDRNDAKTPEEIEDVYRRCLTADAYFMSANAVTKDGVLVNIDGRGNRAAALVYGPKQVIILAGMNKVVPSVEEAVSRVRNTATPPNCIRLGKQTPCAAAGACCDCLSDDCICNQVVITRRNGIKGRIKVLLIGENLGF